VRAGNQSIIISGNNFGAFLGPSDSVFYTLRVTNPVNTSLPVQSISPGTNGTVILQPTGCFVSVPHIEIRTFIHTTHCLWLGMLLAIRCEGFG
jgi:hypothetical protein